MHGRTGTSNGRTELLVVLTISMAGVAVAAAVLLAPWHPTTWSLHHDTRTVIQLRPPAHHGHHSDEVQGEVPVARR
ncbi:MAG: hypothetical protein WCA46_04200 [Actinocatenispora sp.]